MEFRLAVLDDVQEIKKVHKDIVKIWISKILKFGMIFILSVYFKRTLGRQIWRL